MIIPNINLAEGQASFYQGQSSIHIYGVQNWYHEEVDRESRS